MKEILLDVRIQKLLETLRTDPEKAQRYVESHYDISGSRIRARAAKT